jgi:hypothetical protein
MNSKAYRIHQSYHVIHLHMFQNIYQQPQFIPHLLYPYEFFILDFIFIIIIIKLELMTFVTYEYEIIKLYVYDL